jgi:hypothetical protein
VRFIAPRPAGVYDALNESQFRVDVERALQQLGGGDAPAAEPTIKDLGTVTADDDVQLDYRATDYCRVQLAGEGTVTILYPLGVKARRTYVVEITHIGADPIELVWGAGFYWPAGEAPTLSAAGGAVDVITLIAASNTKLFGVGQNDFLSEPRPEEEV